MFKAKLLGDTDGHQANGISRNLAIPLPLKYPSNFWRSLEMPLINCKVKRMNLCVLSSNVTDNPNANTNIIFTIRVTKLYIFLAPFSAKDNQKLLKLSKQRV